MKALVIGYGSIGKRHYEVLSQMEAITKIDIVTAQTLSGMTTFPTLENVENLDNYDYFVIASETFKHFDQLEYLEKNTKNKIILCEKPLFDRQNRIKIKNNEVYVGYVLRFHPLLQRISTLLKEEDTPISVQIKCGSYLPSWRTEKDYRQSYSASKEKGGGVLLDLSHEIDYLQWLFGKVESIASLQLKVSNLEIDSDDLVSAIGKTEKGITFILSMDYISKITLREIIVHSNNRTIQADFIKNMLNIGYNNGHVDIFEFGEHSRNSLFCDMYKSMFGEKADLCTLEEGLAVMETISKIQEQNHG